MKIPAQLPPLLESFFTQRLMAQRKASPHTIAAYRDTFSLLLKFAQRHLGREPSKLMLEDLDAVLIASFLEDLESGRHCCPRSRNVRLAAIRSFFRYAAVEAPQHAGLIQRILSIPRKRHVQRVIDFLTRDEIKALLSAVDRTTWLGRRDHAILLIAVQTGLRLSEITSLCRTDVVLEAGAHVRCIGKGRKERCTPLSKPAVAVLGAWMKDAVTIQSPFLFPSSRSGRLSADAVQRLVARHAGNAQKNCPSLAKKRVTPHVLRHSAAMELLQAGVDRALIAIWLGHESVETTQVYLDADLTLKEAMLAKARPIEGTPVRYRPNDRLVQFLKAL
ncbi:MAG: tyrosine-type recombinase/integrase [Opitutaceae bacterium]|jgi:site-specific recombinase XerD